MRYHVAQLLREPVGSTRQYTIHEAAPDLGPDAMATAPVRGAVRLMRTGQGILASATLSTRVRLACSRCLGDVEEDLTFSFDEEFRPTVDLATGAPLAMPDPADEWSMIDKLHILDLSDVVRQNALLALPMKPLCEEACPGLCPVCGQARANGCRCVGPSAVASAEGPLAAALRTWLERQGLR
jgi:uncharacterized protein